MFVSRVMGLQIFLTILSLIIIFVSITLNFHVIAEEIIFVTNNSGSLKH